MSIEPLPKRPRGRAAEHRIEIAASADTIWSVLADVDHWGGWNPVYPKASGSLAPGGRIDLTIALPGMKPQKSPASVLIAMPGRALQFGAAAFGGLLFATRYVEIHPLDGGRSMVVNGEAFRRPLGGLLVRAMGSRIEDSMRLQNEGLKAKAESLQQAA